MSWPSFLPPPGPRDWPEDAAADDDNGCYSNDCVFCGASFIGHKRRYVCKICTPSPTPARRATEALYEADLECLIRWPADTRGEAEERALLQQLNRMCLKYGYGRISQLASQMHKLWGDPEQKASFELDKQRHIAMLTDYHYQ